MSDNKSSFRSIYYSHGKLNNYHMFITINAHVTLLYMDLSLGRLIFKKITYTQPFILKNKLISPNKSLFWLIYYAHVKPNNFIHM